MTGIATLAQGLAGWISRETGIRTTAGRMENAVYPCCLIETAGKLEAGTRQLHRTVTVTLTCFASREREREEGMALMDTLEQALIGGFEIGGRKYYPQSIESLLDGKERPKLTFSLDYYDVPSEGGSGGSGAATERMETLSLMIDTKKED